MSVFRTFTLARNKTLQLGAEDCSTSNTPHYAKPTGSINNVTL